MKSQTDSDLKIVNFEWKQEISFCKHSCYVVCLSVESGQTAPRWVPWSLMVLTWTTFSKSRLILCPGWSGAAVRTTDPPSSTSALRRAVSGSTTKLCAPIMWMPFTGTRMVKVGQYGIMVVWRWGEMRVVWGWGDVVWGWGEVVWGWG